MPPASSAVEANLFSEPMAIITARFSGDSRGIRHFSITCS